MKRLPRSIENCLLTVKVFKRDVQVKFSSRKQITIIPKAKKGYKIIQEIEEKKKPEKRSRIIHFSKKSAKRLRHVVRNTEDYWKTFITLTYPENFPCDGKQTKAHLNAFLQWLRRKAIKYVWVLEFQQRGAPHYHIIASECIPLKELSERWYQIVGSGDEKHLRAGTGISLIQSKRHLYGYLSNYVKKLDQKTPPENFENVGRFWGATRNILIFKFYQKINHYYNLVRHIKLLRNWYKARLRGFGIKWKWKGQGFTALDGVLLVKQLMSIRQ